MTRSEIESLLAAIAEAVGRLHAVEAEYLRRIRHERGWSQVDLATALKVPRSFVAMVEAGYDGRHMKPHHWQRLWETLDSFCPKCGQGIVDICPHCGHEKGEDDAL